MRKIKGLRWYMIALVTMGTVLGYLTRNTVAAAGSWRGRRGGSGDDPGRPEGQLRMVPGKRTLYCRRLLQRGLLNRRDDRPAAGRLGDCDAQLADGVHYLRCPEFYLGHGVAGLL